MIGSQSMSGGTHETVCSPFVVLTGFLLRNRESVSGEIELRHQILWQVRFSYLFRSVPIVWHY